jgi:hypothetical protein
LLYKKIEYYQKMYGDRAIEELNKNSEFQKFGKV